MPDIVESPDADSGAVAVCQGSFLMLGTRECAYSGIRVRAEFLPASLRDGYGCFIKARSYAAKPGVFAAEM